MTLLQECMEVLKNNIYIIWRRTKKYGRSIFDTIPFTNWGRVDWSIIKNKKILNLLRN